MLIANQYALENASIQTMVGIRQKELDYLNLRANAIGTQAALLVGFIISTFAVNAFVPSRGDDDGGIESSYGGISLLFYSTATGIVGLVHCVVSTTFLSIWGPGLALRGATGSVSKAYVQMAAEMKLVVVSFAVGIVSFYFNCAGIFFCNQGVGNGFPVEATVASLIMLVGLVFTSADMFRMGYRLRMDDSTGPQSIHEVAAAVQHKRRVYEGMDMNHVGAIEKHEDWSSDLDPEIFSGGKEQLRELYGQASMAAWLTRKSTKFVAFDKWDRQFFVLQGVTLRSYKSQADALAHGTTLHRIRSADKALARHLKGSAGDTLGATLRRQRKAGTAKGRGVSGGGVKEDEAPRGAVSVYLKGYEVLLDPDDPNFTFCLNPIDSLQNRLKTITLRAESADEREFWVRALLAATLVASAHLE